MLPRVLGLLARLSALVLCGCPSAPAPAPPPPPRRAEPPIGPAVPAPTPPDGGPLDGGALAVADAAAGGEGEAGDGAARPALALDPLDPTAPLADPLDRLLGQTREEVDRQMGPGEDRADGWVRYHPAWALRYGPCCGRPGDPGAGAHPGCARAVELAVRLPPGIGCGDSLHGVGFANRGPALRRHDHCLWPPDSLRHSLGPGLAGRLDFATGLLVAGLTAPGCGDPPPRRPR